MAKYLLLVDTRKAFKTFKTEVLGKYLKSENWVNPPFEEIASTIINAIVDMAFITSSGRSIIARVTCR